MKKLILFLALTLVMCGCSNVTTEKETTEQNAVPKTIVPEVILIDSCEYIVCYSIGGTQSMVWKEPIYIHKGNCKYCQERRKKEQEELIRKIKEQ